MGLDLDGEKGDGARPRQAEGRKHSGMLKTQRGFGKVKDVGIKHNPIPSRWM